MTIAQRGCPHGWAVSSSATGSAFTLPGTAPGGGVQDYSLADFAGKPVVIAFYPGDDTAVCTKQLNDYNDGLESFNELDAQVLGISPQDLDSHERFSSKYGFKFPLLADTDKAVARPLRHARADRVPPPQRVHRRRRRDDPLRPPGDRRADVPPGQRARRSVAAGPAGSSRRGIHPLVAIGPLQCEPVFVRHRYRVLGIDPGLTRCGYAVIDANGPSTGVAVALGVIRTPTSEALPWRLAMLREEFARLIAEFAPDVVAVEQVFFQVNVRTAMGVGQASGLALAEAAHAGCDVVQYTPNQVKDAVAGWGAAPKEQVQKMVKARLGLTAPPQPADAADAAALALCHLAMAPLRRAMSGAQAGAAR